MEDIRTTRHESGLTILTDKMPGVRSATLGFFFRTGARFEPAELNGISHFIEHVVFKGTRNRTALEIAVEQDRLGGNFDAFTTHEETGFAIKVIDDQTAAAFDLIADMLTNSSFDEKELESEQRVIIEEMKMTEDSPEDYLGEIFNESVFAGHPLGTNIAGTPDTVRKFDTGVTRKYHEQHFTAANLVIAAAGNIEHDEIVDLAVSPAFRWLSGGRPGLDSSAGGQQDSRRDGGGTPKLAAPIVVKQNKNLEQAHLIIATPFVSARDDRRYAADLLANIIGGGTSSRLWQKIREDRGLAYSVGTSVAMYQDCGIFTIFAGTSPEQTAEVVDISVAEMRAVVKNGIRESELELAKQQSRASILLSLEDSAARAASIAQTEMLYGRHIPVEETLAKIETVTAGELHDLAREYFKTEDVAFTALGNLKGFKIDRDRLAIS
ncbi:MAG: pitrilysin family protein [Acidobacteriota bacterium]